MVSSSGQTGRTLRENKKLSTRAAEARLSGGQIPGLANHQIQDTSNTNSLRSEMASAQDTPKSMHTPDVSRRQSAATTGNSTPRASGSASLKRKSSWDNILAHDFADADMVDDWTEFATPGPSDRTTLKSSVVSTFVRRAKRALRAGKSWQVFEEEERSIDSSENAKAETDPEVKAKLEEYVLDNDVRLAYFDTIKERLCDEIWEEALPERAEPSKKRKKDSKVDDEIAVPASKKQSVAKVAQALTSPEESVNDIDGFRGPFVDDGQPQSSGVLGTLTKEERAEIRKHPEYANVKPRW